MLLYSPVGDNGTAQLYRPGVPRDWRPHRFLRRVQLGGGFPGAADGITGAFASLAAAHSHTKGKTGREARDGRGNVMVCLRFSTYLVVLLPTAFPFGMRLAFTPGGVASTKAEKRNSKIEEKYLHRASNTGVLVHSR